MEEEEAAPAKPYILRLPVADIARHARPHRPLFTVQGRHCAHIAEFRENAAFRPGRCGSRPRCDAARAAHLDGQPADPARCHAQGGPTSLRWAPARPWPTSRPWSRLARVGGRPAPPPRPCQPAPSIGSFAASCSSARGLAQRMKKLGAGSSLRARGAAQRAHGAGARRRHGGSMLRLSCRFSACGPTPAARQRGSASSISDSPPGWLLPCCHTRRLDARQHTRGAALAMAPHAPTTPSRRG
jgi:hypothetical protein